RSVLPGDMWRITPRSGDTAAGALRLKVSAKRRIRVGRSATVRWKLSGRQHERVVRWRVLLNGKRVRTVAAEKSLLRKRVSRVGTHRWKVVGVDAEGKRVVVAARNFTVLRRR
ncbi:MAG TPA: hypothetical protein VGR11_04815, partial [Solirubrobacteraceae bacterium]|nr:hypothetical protein [Solirubrobacteraceae bacterium]